MCLNCIDQGNVHVQNVPAYHPAEVHFGIIHSVASGPSLHVQ